MCYSNKIMYYSNRFRSLSPKVVTFSNLRVTDENLPLLFIFSRRHNDKIWRPSVEKHMLCHLSSLAANG